MLPIIFIPPGPSPSGDCKPTVEKADGALSLLSFPRPLSTAWERHIPTHLRQWPQKWGRRLSSRSSLSMTTFSIPRISLLFFFFFNHLFSLFTMAYFCLCGPFLHLVETLKHTYF